MTEFRGRTLDWAPRFDERSRDYRFGAATLPRSNKWWAHGPVLDQGSEGACVGFACAGEAAASPKRVAGVSNGYALSLYRRAQQLDEWAGEAYSGTSVLAGCLAGRERGLWAGFRWAFSAEELAAAVVRLGPAVIGVEWRADSYDTDTLGVLRSSGRPVGGHALLVVGFIDPTRLTTYMRARLRTAGLLDGVLSVGGPSFLVLNSWGDNFGKRGLCVVPLDVMRRWSADRAELAIPEGRALGKVATP